MENNITSTTDIMVEPLTRRESEVLLLLSENLFDREIADRLSLALSSVKGYTRNIYGKLGVNNRREAVARARKYGLLSPGKPVKTSRSVYNIPRQLTRLIGREKEISRGKKLLRENPLVTLTGSGGVGKTRLALAVAEAFDPLEQASDFPDGIGFVELASISDPQLIAWSIANVFNLRADPGLGALEVLLNYLKDRQVLLVIDNCEHLIDACAALITTLLRTSPGLKVLVTSREPLGMIGEMIVRVPSLSIPEMNDKPVTGDLHQYEAVRLFLDRAQHVLPEFQLIPQNTAQVAQICQRLDGIPLAIELAASRVASLDVNQIATRLERTFRLLAGGVRAVSERQRTLRATIDWSYNLLSPEERLLLQRLSVFNGGWTLEAAELICAGEGIAEEDVADLLALMVNKSMVVTTLGVSYWLGDPLPGYTMRFRLLNTVHQYAQERFLDSGAVERWHNRHLTYFLTMAETIEEKLHTGERLDRMSQLFIEQDNLRAALTWSLTDSSGAHAQEGLRLANALLDFWSCIQSPEGYNWLQNGLALIQQDDPLNTSLVARTYHSLTALALRQVGITQQRQFAEESVKRYRACEDQPGLARALRYLGCMYTLDGYDQALPFWDESLALYRRLGSKWDMADLIYVRYAYLPCESYKDETQALASAQESEALFLETGDRWSTLGPLYTQALIYARRGDVTRVREYYEKILLINHDLEKTPLTNHGIYEIGLLAYYLQEYTRMETQFQYILEIGQKSNDSYLSLEALQYLAIAAKYQDQTLRAVNLSLQALKEIPVGDDDHIRSNLIVPSLIAMAGIAASFQPVRVAGLLGAVEALQENLTVPSYYVIFHLEFDRDVAALHSQLDVEIFRSAWAEGRAFTLEQAYQEALTLGEELAKGL